MSYTQYYINHVIHTVLLTMSYTQHYIHHVIHSTILTMTYTVLLTMSYTLRMIGSLAISRSPVLMGLFQSATLNICYQYSILYTIVLYILQ